MKEHVLLKHSTRRRYAEVPELPEEATYDTRLGYWHLQGLPLVRTRQFLDHSISKKCDQETGEDQKGE